jgi:cell division protein FtsL
MVGGARKWTVIGKIGATNVVRRGNMKYTIYLALVVAYLVLFLSVRSVIDQQKTHINELRQKITAVSSEVYRQSEWINGIDYIYLTEVE